MSYRLEKRGALLTVVCFLLVLLSPWTGLHALIAIGLSTILWVETDAYERRGLLRKNAVLLFFVLMAVLPLLWERTQGQAYVRLAGWGISYHGVLQSVSTFFRVWASVLAVQVFVLFVPMYRLFQRLREWGVPRLLIELMELTYRYIHTVGESAEHIHRAQLSRLTSSVGYMQGLRNTGMLLSQTFILAHHDSDELYEGLISRGFVEEGQASELSSGRPMARGEELITLKNLVYAYHPEKVVLRGLNSTIRSGEAIALIGVNGVGKSTLMRVLSGLLEHTDGQLIVNGQAVTNAKGRSVLRERVRLVFQDSNHQLFTPSVEDEIRFGLRNLSLSAEEVDLRTEQTLELFGLSDLRALAPHKLSEGQKKWVALASIIALDPDVILLDEPTACLDSVYTRRILSLLKSLHLKGKTILLSTHDMDLAYQWAERVLVMQAGEIVADGGADEIFRNLPLLERTNLVQPLRVQFSQETKETDAPKTSEMLRRFVDHNLPLYHSTDGMSALIVGGGRAALRKVRTLLSAGVRCRVLSPEILPELMALVDGTRLSYVEGKYSLSVRLDPYQLVVSATGCSEVDESIALRATAEGKLFSSTSNPNLSNVHFAANQSRAGVNIAVHSAYQLPEVSSMIRTLCVDALPADLEEMLQHLSLIRQEYSARDPQYIELFKMIEQKIKDDWFNRNKS